MMTRTSSNRAAGSTAALRRPILALSLVAIVAVAGEAAAQEETPVNTAPIPGLLAAKQAVFGIFGGPKTPEDGMEKGKIAEADFVFYSLETGPFDLERMRAYAKGMAEGAGERGAQPLALRIPPVGEDEAGARERLKAGVEAGARLIVVPHVRHARDAAIAVDAVGDRLYPRNRRGDVVLMLIVEDREGVANAKEIAKTPGVSVVFAGPGDLNRAYQRDAAAVENAIQTILAACKEAGVPAGITAGAADIAERLKQGFSVYIVQRPDALTAGREAAGRR
jgi:hypothetical protein